jgi:hypothetical protein
VSRVIAILFVFALSGCAQVQLEHQTDSFNRASASSISEHALLNAVRSSLDMPMSFTKLLKFTAGNMANGSIAPKLPFGSDATRLFDIGPSLSFSSGVGQIEYADANNSSALGSLNKYLRYDVFDRYVYQGVHPALLLTILVEHVEISSKLLAALQDERRARCGITQSALIGRVCEQLDRMSSRCRWSSDIFEASDASLAKVTIDNRAHNECSFHMFQAFRYLLVISDFWSDAVTTTSVGKQKTAEGSILDVPKSSTDMDAGFDNTRMQKIYDRIRRELKEDYTRKSKAGKNPVQQYALAFAYRSPKSLLAYLGELIALQNFSREKYVPRIRVGKELKEMTVFRVVRENASPGRSALSVIGPDRAAYVVLEPEYGYEFRDQTLRVLAIAGELVNGALSEKDFPAPATVVVRSF